MPANKVFMFFLEIFIDLNNEKSLNFICSKLIFAQCSAFVPGKTRKNIYHQQVRAKEKNIINAYRQ